MSMELMNLNVLQFMEIKPKTVLRTVFDPFKGLCPVCGDKLSHKIIKKSKRMFQRSVKSFVCPGCGYAEYDNNESETAILSGIYDDEI